MIRRLTIHVMSDILAAEHTTAVLMGKEYTNELLLDFGADGTTLIPVVTQDAVTKEVLILAFANKDAFDETVKSGHATYWSRSRNELWKKGMTSGDMLRIIEIRINCEQNSLLYLVKPEGKGACHAKKADGSPYRSCYYRKISGSKLEMV
ncbi:MAG: phosphoribosyl-AMP cyclohydrolase [Spirochaetota bacterium]